MTGIETAAAVGAGASASTGAAASGISAATAIQVAAAAAAAATTLAAANKQATTTKQNAKAADFAAQGAEANASAEAARVQEANARRLATGQNNLAANGVVTTSGTALELMADSAAEASLDEQIIQWKGKQDAAALRARAGTLRSQAADISTSGTYGAASSLLTTGASIYAKRK